MFRRKKQPTLAEALKADRITTNPATGAFRIERRFLLASELRSRLWADPHRQRQSAVTVPLEQYIQIIEELEK